MTELETSALLAPGFPRRPGMTHAQVAGDPAAYQRATADSGQAALVAGILAAQAIERLGRARHAPAVPLLIRLWSSCPIRDVWQAAGAALLVIGTPEALDALGAHLDEYDPDGCITQIAVRAIFRADPATAHDRLAGHFDRRRLTSPGGGAVPFRVIKALGPIGKDAKGGLLWVDPAAPEWFGADARWLDLCVALQREKPLRDIIAHVLDYADPAEVAAAEAKAARGKPDRSRRVAAGDLLTRYRRGEHAEVWRALRRFEAVEGAMRAEALAVAVETMRRVARCCDLIAERIAAEGWVALSGALRSPPDPDLPALLASVEGAAGSPLPPSMVAFWQEVGAVDFVWDYRQTRRAPMLCPGVDLADMDPLAVDGPREPCALWLDARSDGGHDRPSPLWLAPDYLRKVNTSGGDPYGVYLPFRGADPIFDGEPHDLPFVDYLRLALRWAGFPGLEAHAGTAAVDAFLSRMTANLEPF